MTITPRPDGSSASAWRLLAHFRAGPLQGRAYKEPSCRSCPYSSCCSFSCGFSSSAHSGGGSRSKSASWTTSPLATRSSRPAVSTAPCSRYLGDDEVRIEIAPDVHVRVARRAIAAVLNEDDDELGELERAQQEAKEEVLAARDADER